MATIPDSAGVIHACYTPESSWHGNLRVINASGGQACKKNEKPLTWNQAGPPGQQGPPGPPGSSSGSGVLGLLVPMQTVPLPVGVPIDYVAWTLPVPPGTYLLDQRDGAPFAVLLHVNAEFTSGTDMSTLKCHIGWADEPDQTLSFTTGTATPQPNGDVIGDANLRFQSGTALPTFNPLTVTGTAPRTLEGVCVGPAPVASPADGFVSTIQFASTLRLIPATVSSGS
jgi:hypothetical protein